MYGWILGRLTTAGWREVALVVPYALCSTVAIVLHRRLIDVLAVGDDEASSLGVRAARVRLVVVAAATLATLIVLPSVYSLFQQSASRTSPSLDPDDPESACRTQG